MTPAQVDELRKEWATLMGGLQELTIRDRKLLPSHLKKASLRVDALLQEAFPALRSGAQALPTAGPSFDAARERWVRWARAFVLMRTEESPDDEQLLSAITGTRQPLDAQLRTLLESKLAAAGADFMKAHASALACLQQYDSNLWTPRSPIADGGNAAATMEFEIPLHVRVCGGSRFERNLDIDALEWLANAGDASLPALISEAVDSERAGRSSDMLEQAVLDLAKDSFQPDLRVGLQELLAYMRSVHGSKEGAGTLGLSVRLPDLNSITRFVAADPHLCARLPGETLESLGIATGGDAVPRPKG